LAAGDEAEAEEGEEKGDDENKDNTSQWALALSVILMFLITIVSGYGFDSNRKMVFQFFVGASWFSLLMTFLWLLTYTGTSGVWVVVTIFMSFVISQTGTTIFGAS